MSKVTVGVGFKTDTSGLIQAKKALQEIANLNVATYTGEADYEKIRGSLDRIKTTAATVEKALNKAFNPKLNTLSVQTFNKELKNSNLTLDNIYKDFSQLGSQGERAFRNLTTQILTTNRQLRETNHFIDSLGDTLMNTIKWQIATNAVNAITGSVNRAYGYVKSLDSSLNDIRIVTNKSADSMDIFAEKANKAAKNLSRTTTDYTNASLIFYQQGLSDEEVAARSEVTLKTANVTQQSTSAVSEQLTAVWNGYKVTAEEAESYVDKLAAVAASTASDLQELSVGMSKVASSANAMGVDIDQLGAQMSTIISATRQAPESIGTALKTIYARLGDLKLEGATDEWGTSLGDVSGQLAEVGIQVTKNNGDLREMGEVIEEIGAKWQTWTAAQKQAIAIVMAGKRQYNNLFALFDNWDNYSKALETSSNSLGTLQKQQDIYTQSTNAKLKQLTAATEGLYDSLLDTDTINFGVESLTQLLSLAETFIDSIGGGSTVLLALGSVAAKVFSKQIGSNIAGVITNFQNMRFNIQQANAELQIMQQFKGLDINDESTKALIDMKAQAIALRDVISDEQNKEINNLIIERNELEQNKQQWEQAAIAANNYLNTLTHSNKIDIFDSTNKSLIQYKANIKFVENQIDKTIKSIDSLASAINNQGILTIETEDNIDLYNTALEKTVNILNNLNNKNQGLQVPVNISNIEDIKAELESLKSTPEELGIKFTNLQSILGTLKNEFLETKNEGQQAFRTIDKEAQGMSDHLQQNIERNKQSFDSLVNSIKGVQIASDISKVVGTVGQLSTAINSVGQIHSIWSAEDLSTGERILRTVMSLSIALPPFIKMIETGAKATIFNDINTQFQSTKKNVAALEALQTASIVTTNKKTAVELAEGKIRNALSKKYLKDANLEKDALENLIFRLKIRKQENQTLLANMINIDKASNKRIEKLNKENKEITEQIFLLQTLNNIKNQENINLDTNAIGESLTEHLQQQQSEMAALEGQAVGATTALGKFTAFLGSGTVAAGIAIASIVALTAAITALIVVYQVQLKKAEDRVNAANKEVEKSQKLLDTYKEEKSAVEELTKSYEELKQQYGMGEISLDNLRTKTYELCMQYDRQDLAVKTLSASYSELNSLMSEAQKNADINVASQSSKAQSDIVELMDAQAHLQTAKWTWTDTKRIFNFPNWTIGQSGGDHGLQVAAGKLRSEKKKSFVTELGSAAGLDYNAIDDIIKTGYINFDMQDLASNWDEVQDVMRSYMKDLGRSDIYKNIQKYFETISDSVAQYETATSDLLTNLSNNLNQQFSNISFESYNDFNIKLEKEIEEYAYKYSLTDKQKEDLRKNFISAFGANIENANLILEDSYYQALKGTKQYKQISSVEAVSNVIETNTIDETKFKQYSPEHASPAGIRLLLEDAERLTEAFTKATSGLWQEMSYEEQDALTYLKQWQPTLYDALEEATKFKSAIAEIPVEIEKFNLDNLKAEFNTEEYRVWITLHPELIVAEEDINKAVEKYQKAIEASQKQETIIEIKTAIENYQVAGIDDEKLKEYYNILKDMPALQGLSEGEFLESQNAIFLLTSALEDFANVNKTDVIEGIEKVDNAIAENREKIVGYQNLLNTLFAYTQDKNYIPKDLLPEDFNIENLKELFITPYQELDDVQKELYGKIEDILKIMGISPEQIKTSIIELDKLTKKEEGLIKLSSELSESTEISFKIKFENTKKDLEDNIDKIGKIAEDYKSLQSIAKKFEEAGGYPTLTDEEKALMDEYSDALKIQNGILDIQIEKFDEARQKSYETALAEAKNALIIAEAHKAELISIMMAGRNVSAELFEINKEINNLNEQILEYSSNVPKSLAELDTTTKSKIDISDNYKNQYDAFHDINIVIQDLTNNLEKLQEAEENLIGNNLIQNLQEQKKAYEDLKEAQKERLAIAQQEANKTKISLAAQGATFDEAGNISNYSSLMGRTDSSASQINKQIQEKQKEYNAAINAGKSNIELEKLQDELDLLEEQQKTIEATNSARTDSIEEYENALKEVNEAEKDLLDTDKNLKELKDKEIDAQLTINDYLLDQNKIELDNIKDNKSDIESDINKTESGAELADYANKIVNSLNEESALYEEQIQILEEKKKKLLEIYAVEHNLSIGENGYASLEDEENRQYAETYNKLWDEYNDGIKEAKKGLKEIQDELDAIDLLKKVDETETIDHEIKKIQRELKNVQAISKHLEGDELIQNLKQQQSILDKEIQQQKRKLIIQQQQLKVSIEQLKIFILTQGYATQLTTDSYGYITNSFALLTEAAEKGEAEFAIMQGLLSSVNNAANVVMDTMYAIEDLEFDKIELDYDIADEIKEQLKKKMEEALEDFNAEIEFRLDISDASRRFNKLVKIFKQNLDEADLFGNAKQNLEDIISYLEVDMPLLSTHVSDILNELAVVQSGGESQYYGKDEQAILDDLASYRDKLMDSLNSVDDLINKIEDSYLNAIDKVKEGFDKIQNSYNQITDIISHNMNLIKLISGENAYGELANYYTKQAGLYEQQLAKTRKELDFWKEKMDNAIAGSDEWEKFEENYTNALSNLNSLIESGVQNLIDKYKNGLDNLFDNYEKELTGGSNLDNVKEQWDLINESADRYYDTVNGTYEIEKLQNKFLDAANDTNNLSIQEKINSVMEKEIEKLREKDKLTKYDVDRANAIYDLTLKQIALEEAQKNKTQMRLRRDSQGNYTYQYVSDEDEVAQKRQELLDAQNALYNIDKQGYEDNLNDLLDLQQKYTERLKEIYADVTLSDEEREEKIKLLKETYGEDINNLVAANEEIRKNLQQSTFDSLEMLYDEDKEKLQQFLDDEGALLMEQLIPQWDSAIQQIANTYDDLGYTMNDVLEDASELVNEYEEDLGFLQDAAGVSFDSIRDGIDFTINDMEDLIDIHDTLLTGYEDEMDAIEDLISELDALRDAYSAVLDEALAVVDAALKVDRLGIKDTDSTSVTTTASKKTSTTTNTSNKKKTDTENQDSNNSNKLHAITDYDANVVFVPAGEWNKASDEVKKRLQNEDRNKDKKIIPVNKTAQELFDEYNKTLGNEDYFFKTGGYTGDWQGDDGKIAVVHSKELILNSDDTENMLKAVSIVRDISSVLFGLNSFVDGQQLGVNPNFNTYPSSEGSSLNQNVHIEASFPNVQNSNEIEEAFNNLINTATQYAFNNRK